MKLNIFSTLLVITASALAAPSAMKDFEKRNPTGSVSLVAYGIASSYIKIFYSDGFPHTYPTFINNQILTLIYRTCLRRRLLAMDLRFCYNGRHM